MLNPGQPGATWQSIAPGDHNVFNLTGAFWHHNISFRSFDNLGQQGPEVTLYIYIEGDTEPPTPPVLTLRVVDDDIIRLEWGYEEFSPAAPDIHHFLIYRSEIKDDFEFIDSEIWVDTSDLSDHGLRPLRFSWNDTEALDDDSDFTELYYTIRAVDNRGNIGYTSNFAGWVTLTFERGYNAFSLPLEPFGDYSASSMIGDSRFTDDRDTIYRYDVENQQWMGHAKDMPSDIDDFTLEMDESYMIYIAENEISFTFAGAPGTSIRFIKGMGEDKDFRDSLTITMVDDDVVLSWDAQGATGADGFAIYKVNNRYGEGSLTDYEQEPIETEPDTTSTWTDENPSLGEYYYIVVARSNGQDQSSTYAIGVRIVELYGDYQSFSFTLEPKPDKSVGSFANEQLQNDRDTLYYHDREASAWQGHPKLLPENINTGNVVMGNGYFVFTPGESTKVAIIGI
jgi:hypothetical protein